MHSSKYALLFLLLLVPPLIHGSHDVPTRKAPPVLSYIGIRSLSVEH